MEYVNNTFIINNTTYDLICIDFETFYGKGYTLSRMSTTLYVMDPQFLIHGVSVIHNGVNTYYNDIDKFREFVFSIDWSKVALLGQNLAFDGLILFKYFGVKAGYHLDTLSMARPFLQNKLKTLGLDTIAKFFGIPGKLAGLEDTKDKRILTPEESERLELYCKNDTDITLKVFEKLLSYFTLQELEAINITIKMYVNPLLQVDLPRITKDIERIKSEKQVLFDKVHKLFPEELQDKTTLTVLRSSEALATVIKHNGLKPPTKKSKTTGKKTYAFARTDLAFQKLAAKNDIAKLIFDARVISKSDTALNKALMLKQFGEYNICPVMLNYWRAQTGRFCMPGYVEVLTPEGWIRMNEYTDQPIMQWEPNGNMSFDANAIMNQFCANPDEQMIQSNNKYIKSIFTREHKIPTFTSGSSNTFKPILAKNLPNQSKNIPLSGNLQTKGISLSDNEIQLLVATQADGYINSIPNKQGRMVSFGFTKAHKKLRLKSLLNVLSIPYTKGKNSNNKKVTTYRIKWKHVPEYLKTAKQFTYELLNMNEHQRNIFLNELQYWDGSKETNSILYYSTNRKNIEIVQTIAHITNRSTYIQEKHSHHKTWNTAYTLRIRPNTVTRSLTKHYSNTTYNKEVYCPTVKTGYFICRSKGTIFITGNSGGDKIQLQNLPRNGEARKSILAPPGHVLLVSDLSQIELRVSAWFAGQQDVLDVFAQGKDVYLDMAAKIYDVPYDSLTKKSPERMVGKVACLGLGYGSGVKTFDNMLKTGAMGPKMNMELSEVNKIVNKYRTSNNKIKAAWGRCETWLYYLSVPLNVDIEQKEDTYKGLVFKQGMIEMPGDNLPLLYPNLYYNPDGDSYSYQGSNTNRRNIYGSLLFENIIQALARNIIVEQMVKVSKKYPVVLSVHDEIILSVPENEIDEATKFVESTMRTSPDWCSDLVIDCESGYAREYSK